MPKSDLFPHRRPQRVGKIAAFAGADELIAATAVLFSVNLVNQDGKS